MKTRIKRFLCLFSALTVLILSSCGYLTGDSKAFEPSPVDYFGYIKDETPDCITVSGDMLTADSCRINIHYSDKYNCNLGNDYGIYRLVKDEWLPVKKQHEAEHCYWNYSTINAGGDKDFKFDWSYEYGRLGRGSYKLVTSCMANCKGYTKQFLISWNFEMPARNLPEENPNPYGYSGKACELEGLTMTAERISPRRFRLSIINNLEDPYVFDRTYALYKRFGGGWLHVKSEVGQAGNCYSKGYPGRDNKYNIVLSCYYGNLSAGDYLIVKRGMPRDEAHKWPPTDWRNRPASDFTYVSAEFHLDTDLPDVDYDAEPHDWCGYTEDSPGLEDIGVEAENLSASGCTVAMQNTGDKLYEVGTGGYLYKLCGDEWLPVKIQDSSALSSNMKFLYPGKSVKLDISWSKKYGRLQPGTYRLVRKIKILDEILKPIKKNLLKSFDFTITDEMTVEKANPFGYSDEAKIAKGYNLSVEQISAHRYKLTLLSGRRSKKIVFIKSFALYKQSGGEWLPLHCKYETDDYYYIEDSTYYGFKTFTGDSYTIDITALYPSLEPGSYRIVVRGDSPGRYKYITADINYQP